MPHVSSQKLNKQNLNKLYSEFGKAFEHAVRNSKTKFFLGDLLTKTEKIMLAKRFAVICLLSEGVPVFYIAESLKMSYSTIFRMSLKYDIGKYADIVNLIKKDRVKLWKILEKVIKAGLPPRVGRGRWKFLYT